MYYLFTPKLSLFRLAVLGKLNNFVKEWIAEISELKVGSVMPSKLVKLYMMQYGVIKGD